MLKKYLSHILKTKAGNKIPIKTVFTLANFFHF